MDTFSSLLLPFAYLDKRGLQKLVFAHKEMKFLLLILLHSVRPKLYAILAFLSARELKRFFSFFYELTDMENKEGRQK